MLRYSASVNAVRVSVVILPRAPTDSINLAPASSLGNSDQHSVIPTHGQVPCMNLSASLLGGLFRSIESCWALLDFRDSLLRVSDQRHKMCHDCSLLGKRRTHYAPRFLESSSPESIGSSMSDIGIYRQNSQNSVKWPLPWTMDIVSASEQVEQRTYVSATI